MKVSIIIPAYNAAETIAATLESLLAQTEPGWEAIVVDDGSRDATAKLARTFVRRDARTRVITQRNGGEAAARNAGIAAAQHEWLLFLDADDWIAPQYLERMTAELAAHPELDAVHCGWARVALDGTQVIEPYQAPTGDMFSVWARRSAFPVHACIVRKALVDSVGRFDTSLKKSPDWDLWQRVARTGARFGAVRAVLAYYRMRPNAASLDAYQLLADGLRVLRQGHAPDPRVPHPHPDHASGAPPDGIRTQEYYLLSWCAGLLLGSGKDATPLLETLKDEPYSELYPEAVAQCLFDAAPLPACGPPAAWEQLWPGIRQRVGQFLVALEAQSQGPELARRAHAALLGMILRHSPTWGSWIEEREQTLARQSTTIEQLEQARQLAEAGRRTGERQLAEREQAIRRLETRIAELEQASALLQREQRDAQLESEARAQTIATQAARLEELEQRAAALERERAELAAAVAGQRARIAALEPELARVEWERGEWQRVVHEHELTMARREAGAWIRLGLRLRILQPLTLGAAPAYEPDPLREQSWQLALAGESMANLVFPPHDRELVRIVIAKASGRTPWAIQLNHPGIRVEAGRRYAVHFAGRADGRRNVKLGVAQAQAPWSGLGLYRTITLTGAWQTFQEEFVATADANARIHFDLGRSRMAVEISALRLHRLPEATAD